MDEELNLYKELLIRFIQSCEIDGFGHIKGIYTKDATAVYQEYLILQNEK